MMKDEGGRIKEEGGRMYKPMLVTRLEPVVEPIVGDHKHSVARCTVKLFTLVYTKH